jgi:hypothetical protein
MAVDVDEGVALECRVADYEADGGLVSARCWTTRFVIRLTSSEYVSTPGPFSR